MIHLAIELPGTLRPNLGLLTPEFIVAGTGLAAILPELILPSARRAAATAWTSLAGLLIAFVVLVMTGPSSEMALHVTEGEGATLFTLTGWRADAFAVFCRALVTGGGALLVLMSIPYTRRMDRGHGEFYAILLFALLGVMLVSGVSDLLSFFVCLELVTISAYVLAAFKRNDLKSTEAGLKYLVIGAVSTAVLLLGIALVYGATGSLSFDRIARAVAQGAPTALLLVGIGLILVGLLFKVGGVPFHVWIPDVYEGAPTPVTAFLVTASKMAGLILLLRLGQAVFLPGIGNPDAMSWVPLLGVLAVITLLFGILGAIAQRSVKRMLAYSSIGHAGYLLMGVAAVVAEGSSGPGPGTSALLYYVMAYFVTSVTAFMVIIAVGAATGSHGSGSYTGLSRRSPFLALAMLLALLSLAGVPPLSGFFGKFLVLRAVVDKELYVLAFIGAGGVIVSLYFYLLWIKEMYMRMPEGGADEAPIHVGKVARTVLWLGIAGMILMGVYMGPFYEWASDAAASLEALGAVVGR
jgi:NADH-quinone oxidoreductase subunit N